jgi:molybdopterin molybdotransferase
LGLIDSGQPQQPGQAPGLLDLAPLDAALGWIDAHTLPLAAELASVADAVGRVLAAPVAAVADIPPFDRAGVDGIALRAEETVGASAYNPLSFRLVPAGGTLALAGAARVGAGEPLPGGADAVIPLDHATLDVAGMCEIVEPAAPGGGVERRGGQVAQGAMMLAAGRRLRPYDIGLLASAGIAQMPVIARPKVRAVLTGRGLAAPGEPSAAGGVYDADGPLLRVLVERDGGILTECRRVGRDRNALCDALAAPGPDIILVAGGTGKGTDDWAAAALAEAGALAIYGVAVYPGEATGMGRNRAGIPVVLLPGAPAACIWGYELFAGRAMRRLAGRNPALPFRSQAMRTRRKLVSRIGMTEICPVRCLDSDTVEPIVSFAEAGLMAAVRADGFVIVAEGSEGFAAGAAVMVYVQDEQDGPTADPPGSVP